MPDQEILTSLGIGHLADAEPYHSDAGGRFVDASGNRIVLVAAETNRSFHRVLEAETPGAWSDAMKAAGGRIGERLAAGFDAALAAEGKPALSALPLEACLALLEYGIASSGWGRLSLDLSDAANYGIVVARLENSFSVETLGTSDRFVDALIAGVLQAFFSHISGQNLGCEEIACAACGAPCCVFVITAPERLAPLASLIGQEPAETLLARLRH